jgi:hypothetical protein
MHGDGGKVQGSSWQARVSENDIVGGQWVHKDADKVIKLLQAYVWGHLNSMGTSSRDNAQGSQITVALLWRPSISAVVRNSSQHLSMVFYTAKAPCGSVSRFLGLTLMLAEYAAILEYSSPP